MEKINPLFTLAKEEVVVEKELKEKQHKVSFEDSFKYLLSSGEKVDFEPFVINHSLSSDQTLLKFCTMFDFYLPKLDRRLMQDLMHTLLPKTKGKYFKYLKRNTTEIPKKLKIEAEVNGISGRNMYQYYCMLFYKESSQKLTW